MVFEMTIAVFCIWFFAGLVAWFILNRDEITLKDIFILPLIMCLGAIALIIILVDFGADTVLWRRKR